MASTREGLPRTWLTLLFGAGLFIATAVLYWPATHNDFVSLDDPAYAFDNRHVTAGLTWDGVRWAFTTFHASNWHPLTWLSLMLDASLFGAGPAGFHTVSVLLHATNAALLFLALQMITGAPWASAATAALFAVHPLRVESVAWVSERKDVLSGFFWMTTLLAYAGYARRGGTGRFVLVGISLALGLLAKPMLVTLPFVLLLLDWWPLGGRRATGDGRVESAPRPADAREGGRGEIARRPSPVARLILEKVPLLAVVVAASAATVVAQRTRGAVASLEMVPLGLRVLNAVAAYGAYLWKTIWPADLSVFYPHAAFLLGEPTAALLGPAAGGALVLVAGSALAVALARRRPYLVTGWFWYVGTLVPVIGLVHVGQQAMADRYAYLPLVGIYVMVVWSARDVALRWPATRFAWAAAAAAVLMLCAVATRRQIAVWRDGRTLFEHAVAVTRDNYFAHTNLAAVLVAMGRDDEAAPHYDAALQIRPRYATALAGLGSLYFRRGRLDEAADLALRALEEEPDSAVVLTNLGAIRFKQERLGEAAIYFERAVAVSPDYAMAHSNLGAIYFRQGQIDLAAEHFARAVALNPASSGAHNNLGVARLQQGRWAEAASEFEAVLRIQPNAADAQRNLAIARQRMGTP